MVNQNDKAIIENFVLSEIKESCPAIYNQKIRGIYAVRINNVEISGIKPGSTSVGIQKRLEQLSDLFDCNGKMILLFYGKEKYPDSEKKIHEELKEFRLSYSFKFGQQSREVYDKDCYDKLKELFDKYVESGYFESKRYRFEDKEYYELSEELDDYLTSKYDPSRIRDYFDDNENIGYILLDEYERENFEEYFWDAVLNIYSPYYYSNENDDYNLNMEKDDSSDKDYKFNPDYDLMDYDDDNDYEDDLMDLE